MGYANIIMDIGIMRIEVIVIFSIDVPNADPDKLSNCISSRNPNLKGHIHLGYIKSI